MIKKISLSFFAFLLGVLALFCAAPIALADSTECEVFVYECNLYQSPSFSSESEDNPHNFVLDSSGEPVVLHSGDRLAILGGGEESDKFLYVQFGDNSGYVYKFFLSINFDSKQDVYPEFNATVLTDGAQLYDINGEAVDGKTLAANTPLHLYQGYTKNEFGMVAVSFVGENGRLESGYLLAKDLSPNGINSAVIIGIVVAISCITIILLLIFMKKQKKNKKGKQTPSLNGPTNFQP